MKLNGPRIPGSRQNMPGCILTYARLLHDRYPLRLLQDRYPMEVAYGVRWGYTPPKQPFSFLGQLAINSARQLFSSVPAGV